MKAARYLYVWLSGAVGAVLAGVATATLWRWSRKKHPPPLRVLITGAAGQIGYALAPAIASGQMFGPHQPVILHLYDIVPAADYLEGLHLELLDSNFTLLAGIVSTTSLTTACQQVSVAILLAGAVRRPNSSKQEQLAANVDIYRPTAAALEQHAAPDVKVLVVASPANTNAAMLLAAGQQLPVSNITSLTRLDHNRAVAQLASKLGVPPSSITNVVAWGSSSQHQLLPYAAAARVDGVPLAELLSEEEADFLSQDWVAAVQQRGRTIYQLRHLSPALSAVRAICDHVRDWLCGTSSGTWVSMGVTSDGSYGIPNGLVFSLPCQCSNGIWSITKGVPLDPATWVALSAIVEDLWEEQALAAGLVAQHKSRQGMHLQQPMQPPQEDQQQQQQEEGRESMQPPPDVQQPQQQQAAAQSATYGQPTAEDLPEAVTTGTQQQGEQLPKLPVQQGVPLPQQEKQQQGELVQEHAQEEQGHEQQLHAGGATVLVESDHGPGQ